MPDKKAYFSRFFFLFFSVETFAKCEAYRVQETEIINR